MQLFFIMSFGQLFRVDVILSFPSEGAILLSSTGIWVKKIYRYAAYGMILTFMLFLVSFNIRIPSLWGRLNYTIFKPGLQLWSIEPLQRYKVPGNQLWQFLKGGWWVSIALGKSIMGCR
jgi:hypothetical protein